MEKITDDNLGVIVERLTNIELENAREHSTIIDQVKRTNGTIADIQKWRYTTNGALILLNIMVVPVIIAVIIKFVLEFIF